jgi:hypothetical protein
VNETDNRYYILFANYTHGMALHGLLTEAGIPNRIAPAPRSIQGELSCGMSLLVKTEDIDNARMCIEQNKAQYHNIVPLADQIKSHQDRYC